MTSTNDGKDVKSNQTSGPKGKKYHIELYKSLEARLSSEDTLEARTEHVCEAWRHVYSLHQHSASSTHPHLLSWLQRHTALTILQSKWQSAPNKDELHNRLSSAIDGLVREASGRQPWEQALLARARWFRGALASPWGHPVLASLLNAPAEPLDDQQVLEWLKEEHGVVFVARLKQLAASKQTSDLALTLAGAVMDRARASRPPPADDGADDTGTSLSSSSSSKQTSDLALTLAGAVMDRARASRPPPADDGADDTGTSSSSSSSSKQTSDLALTLAGAVMDRARASRPPPADDGADDTGTSSSSSLSSKQTSDLALTLAGAVMDRARASRPPPADDGADDTGTSSSSSSSSKQTSDLALTLAGAVMDRARASRPPPADDGADDTGTSSSSSSSSKQTSDLALTLAGAVMDRARASRPPPADDTGTSSSSSSSSKQTSDLALTLAGAVMDRARASRPPPADDGADDTGTSSSSSSSSKQTSDLALTLAGAVMDRARASRPPPADDTGTSSSSSSSSSKQTSDLALTLAGAVMDRARASRPPPADDGADDTGTSSSSSSSSKQTSDLALTLAGAVMDRARASRPPPADDGADDSGTSSSSSSSSKQTSDLALTLAGAVMDRARASRPPPADDGADDTGTSSSSSSSSKQTSDLALTLAGAVMDRARASRPPPADDGADDTADSKEDGTSFYAVLRRDAGFLEVWDLLTDIEFVLLHKQEKRARCIELAKQTPLRDGYQLVERLRSRLETAPRDKKLWKNAKEVATLIAQVIIARCMVVTTCSGAARTALYCCARSLARLVPGARLPAVSAALAAPAATARHLHTLCSAIHAQCEGGMKPFVCELYVRAITAGMNELERLKLNAEKQAEARSSEQTLATWFLQLGNILGASARLRAECALTAFSVHPAPDMFERVRQARPPPPATDAQQDKAAEPSFNSWANDSRTQSNLVKTSETLQLKHTPRQANVLSTAVLTEGEALGLEPELGQDLAVLLAGPRVKTLSWHMDRELLLENCRAYMDRTHGGTKALTTELKYLNLDLSAFQHLPEEGDDENDAYYGIEKGYEHLVQLEEPEEIWQNAFFDPELTESADSGPERRREASSGDEDPLSLIAEAKRATSRDGHNTGDKSKDRTRERRKHKEKKNKKERKKKSDPPPADDGTDAPKKETKRVRKKKERRREDSVTDHDGKDKESVLFDGVFSMDELKSPEKRRESTDNPIPTLINSSSPTAINKIISSPIPAFNRSRLEAASTQKKSSTSSDSDVSGTRSPYLTPNQLMHCHVVNDKVKRSITKLLQFRRNKNAQRTPVATPKTDSAGVTPTPSAPRNEAPGLHLDSNQKQQLQAMNHLLNTAMEIKNSEMRKTPYYDTPDYDKLMSPQSIYNLQKQQEVIHYMSQNMPNALNDNRDAHNEYLQSSPHKYSNHLQNQPPRPASVMDTSYVSPSKADKYYGLTPPNPENRLSHQTFHKSMQDLSQIDSTKPSQSQTRFNNQYTNKTLEASRHDHAKSTSHLDSRLGSVKSTNLHNSTATSSIQHYPVLTKTKDDYAKTIKTITDRISQSKSSAHNTQPSSNFSSSKHLSSSMHNVNDSLTVRNDISRTYSAQTNLMNQYTEVSKASRDIPATHAKPKPQQSFTQHSNKDKPCTIRNPQSKPETVKTTCRITEEETQSSFKEFLKELQDTINAGVSDNGNYESLTLNNQVKVTPLNPAAQTKTDAPCAKQTKPQKKTETAPNTFSRLSYMHKNKQSEIRNKESDLKLLNKNILDHKISKTKFIKNDVTISRVPKQSPVKNAAQCNPPKSNHPVLSSMLNYSSPVDPYKEMRQSSAVTTPNQSSDSINREHADLLLLLRNQQTLLPNRVPFNDVDPLKHNACNTQTKDTPVPATYQRSEDNYVINKKVEPTVLVQNPQIPKESTNEVEKQQQDWESVMNALRQHKTQPLGPNALDMALENKNKSSQTTPKSYASRKQKPSSSSSQNKEVKKREDSTPRSHTPKPSLRKEGTPKIQNRTEAAKKKPQETPKTKETPIIKHYSNNTVKQDDPFISGIPNSDYDLLEELMDDDLRQEIGELSSDEERYQAQTVPKVKGAIPKTNYCTKVSDPPKAKPPVGPTVCKNANLNVPEMKTMVNAAPTGYPNVIINPVLPTPENRPTVVCTNIPQRIPNTQHAVPNMISNPGNQIPQPVPNTQHVVPNMIPNPGNQMAQPIANTQNMVPNMIQNPGNQYVANIHSNHMEGANLILTQIPAQPMVLISQELVYDPYPTIRIQESQVSAGLCNVAPNAFVTINPTPNIAVYQTTQFAAPVINPVFIGNAMTSTNVTEQQQNVTPQQEQCPVENLPNSVTDSVQDPVLPEKLISDINMNKCSERKVLSQMQDNNSLGATEKDVHIRRLSVDKSPLKSNEDEERIKLKRHALMNRAIDHACFHPPIPLSYTPLSKKLDLEKLLDEPKNGAVKSTFKLRSSSTIGNKDVVAKTNVETPKSESNNENIERTETSSTKENQKKSRVFHRSFSKSKTTNRKFARVPLRRSKLKPTIINKVAENPSEVVADKTKTETKTPTRISKRIMNKTTPKVDITKSSTTLGDINEVQNNIKATNEDKLDSEKLLPGLEKVAVSEQVNATEKPTPDLEKIPISDSSNAPSGSEVSTVSSKPKQEAVKEVSPNKNKKLATEILPPCHVKLDASREKHVVAKHVTLTASAKIPVPVETAEKFVTKIIVKSPASNPPPKEPILMTIKNQNQAILSNAYTTKNITKEVQNKVNNVIPKTVDSSVQTALPKPVSTNTDKTKLLRTTTMLDSSNKIINTKNVNQDKKNLQDKDVNLASTKDNEVQADKQKALPINSVPVNSKSLLKPIERTVKIAANITTPKKPIDNRHVEVINSETDNPVKKTTTTQVNSGLNPNPQVVKTSRDRETQAPPVKSIPQPIKPKDKEIVNSKPLNDPKITNQVLNTKSTRAQQDKSNQHDFTKDDIIIEEVPIPNNPDPAKKCVRVKLPNGKVFKATVHGKMNVNYDTLFADPSMRSVLKEGLIDGKRYTLNIKQVSKTVKNDPSKIIDTKIREINIKEKITPIDTVNLISDDEEDEARFFSTEFGKYPTNVDLENVNKHQKKFDQKCSVKLTRDDIFKSNRTKPKPKSFPSTPISLLTRTKSKLAAEMQNKSTTNQEPAQTINLQNKQNYLPVVNLATNSLNNEASKTLPTDPEIIEIDDSSSDCEPIPSLLCTETMTEPVKKITELKSILLKDLGVVDNTNDEPMMIFPGKELVVDNLKCALLEDLGVLSPAKQPENQNAVTENKEKSTNHTKQTENLNTLTCKNITVKNCVVKITKCEDLIKKYELIRNAKKCFVKLQRCNISPSVVNTEVSKSDILEPSFDCNEDIIDFDIEETSSPQLSRCPSLSILNNLWDESCLQSPECLYGRSSPVMEIFDALVCLRDKFEDKIKLSKTTEALKLWICDTEWTMTKHEYNVQEMYVKNDLRESEPECSIDKIKTFTVPRLITIVLKFLEKYSDFVYRMHSVHIMKTKSLINNPSNNLKRKPEHLENNIACKMLKLGTLVINAINTYSEETLKALTVNSFKEETTIKLDSTLDRQGNGNKNSEIECNHVDSLHKESVIEGQDMYLLTQKRKNIDTSIENIENNQQSTENIEGCDVVLTNKTLENKTDNMETGETVTCNDCSDEQTKEHQNCNVSDVIAIPSVPKELCEEAINAEYNENKEIVDEIKVPICGEVPNTCNEINESCSPSQIKPLDTVISIVNEEESTPVDEQQNTEIMQKTTDSDSMNSENKDGSIVIEDISSNNCEIDNTNTESEISITPQQCETTEDYIEHRVITHDTGNPDDKEPTQIKSVDLKKQISPAVITKPQDISSEIQNTDKSAEKELDNIEQANDESASVSEIDLDHEKSQLPSNNADEFQKEKTDSDVKNDATLVEIPICHIHNEVCEVEIRDTDLEDNTEIQFLTTLKDPENMNTDAVTDAQNDSSDSISSPDFIDNKEIIFNYHDYTKKPKTKTDTKIENVIKSKPERKYELIQEDDLLTVITTEHDDDPTERNEPTSPIEKVKEIFEESVLSPDTENEGVTLTGIEIDDPVIGTCYVFTLNESGSTEGSNVSIENIDQESSDETVNSVLYKDLHDIEFCVIAPKVTYSRGHLKRKMDMRDIKVTAKKYRKGKNIDCSKATVTSIIESAYSKEYKRLLEYCSSVKFSYSRPFHKDYIDVEELNANWPINKSYSHVPQDRPDENLFVDVQITPPYQPDPATQTLVQEITHEYVKTDALPENPTVEAHETNFDMGFGEGSGRVIQILKKGGGSNISAATLSDVKQIQPAFMSEDHNCAVLTTMDDQIKKIRQYVSFIELRDKVRSFFKKTNAELKLEQQDIKESEIKSRWSDRMNFPYDLCSLDYVRPPPTDAIVQVVQLGQLPVSAAAQNPVTCDPRVTQVSDASPSQCSVDNSPNDDSQSEIKTEYTELTTADITLPMVQEYAQQNQTMTIDSHEENDLLLTEQTISLEMEIKAEERPEIKQELPEIKEEGNHSEDNGDLHTLTNATPENIEYLYNNNTARTASDNVYESSEQNSEAFTQQRQHNGSTEKTDQIAHAMNAAGITTMSESLNNSRAHALVNILSQKIRQGAVNTTQTTTNTYSKTTSINAMALQQALAQILPPPLNQTGSNDNQGPQVVHIVQGKNAAGNQITLVDNTPQSVISTPNATQVLHIVQNKGATAGQTSNGNLAQQPNSFSGISLVDAGLQQGGNQLLHIVNTGNQKNANAAGQLLKRVNLLTNLANVQGSNEQKMVQFVCKSADGKAIQLNAPHQRSMVLRLQPIETSNVQTPAKPVESQDQSSSPTNSSNKDSANQQEIKSRSIYEENYAKFIQNSSAKTPNTEKSTSLPKFNQAFGKAVFQEGQKPAEGASNNAHLATVNTENPECAATDNAMNLEAMRQISSPPLLIRKPVVTTTQSPSNIVQQIKQTIAPMNIQTMHGGVIYTRQIPVNIGGGQTINLITVPSTELINDESKPQTANQSEGEPSIIKIVPQNQNTSNTEGSQEENHTHINANSETAPTPQPQPVLTQMRIKLPMLSKAPQMVPGARVVRPSFFQIQRNVIGGANQPVYQQLVLTAAPPLGQQTIRLPQAQAARPVKVPSENQSSSESQMSSSTLEQLREFDMVLEQVKERSTVQPGTTSNNSSFKLQNNSSDATDGNSSSNCSSEPTQVLYSIGSNQSLNVAYVNRKATVTTPTTSTFVRSPDSTGIADSPTSSTHSHIPHTVTSDSSPTEMSSQSKPAKVGSKSKSRPKSSSNPPNTLKLNSVPPKTSSQKPLEDEQTTQRILYILAEYKEQVENSPDKDKPAPRRRSNPPSNPGSSKRKKSSSSRRSGTRDMSPVHGEDTCRTMGSEDSSCGTSQGDCNESCLDSHSPQDSPRKVARKITFDQEIPATQTRPPQRNVIVADGQTITVARSATGKPATAVLMPANYILPVSMVKGGQQIAIVTNRGPKLLTVGGGEAGAANALLLQRLIGPGGLKPVLARPGVRHVRLPTTALHNLQAFNLASATVQPPDSTASPTPGPNPPELVDTRATSSPWTDREDVKPERGSSPEGSEPWNLPSSADAHEYTYEETVRTDNMERTVLDPVPGRYSPDMEAQRIFDKMFDVEKRSYVDSPRCTYDIDSTDGDDKAYQVVQKKDGTHRQHRLSHVSAAALRHKYAILEHELRLQKSLSEECEDLGVDSPSASELFPEAELLFAASPAPDHDHAPQAHQNSIPQPDLDDQIATDQLLARDALDGAPLDHEEFARAHPNTTFTSEPDAEVQPFTITGLKGRHITSTIFHSNSAPATVLMAPSVIAQPDKYEPGAPARAPPPPKDGGLARYDAILADSRDHLTNTSTIVHTPGNAAQVIRRVCYEDDKRDARYLIDEPDNLIAGDDAKMVADDSRDATLESMADVDDDHSSPERHAELFWESNSASERSESRRPLDFSSDSDKCCKSPFEETNSTDSSGGAHMRLDTVIKEARARERSGSAGSDEQPPLRTYPAKRPHHDGESVSGKTRAGESPDGGVRRRASGRGVVKRGCHCCSGSPLPARAKKPRQRKPTLDFTN